MNTQRYKTTRLEIRNQLHESYRIELMNDIREGLSAPQKFIPSKYFYDQEGSLLFKEICALPEYYLTRTELSILRNHASNIIGDFQHGDIIELGAGACWKIRELLGAARPHMKNIRYVPFDVSESAMIDSSGELLSHYPDLRIVGIVDDFTKDLKSLPKERPLFIILFGSTLGNFETDERRTFLQSLVSTMKPGDRFLLGLDMVKSPDILEAAYNDSEGITAAFNLNVLKVINQGLNANFDMSHFEHKAVYNADWERIEMYLCANRSVSVEIEDIDLTIDLEKGETIRTEICQKFSRECTEDMIRESGMKIARWFSDPKGWFSLVEVVSEDK